MPTLLYMRIGKVMGRVTHSVLYSTLQGGRFMIVQVLDRFALAGEESQTVETVVAYDHLGAGMGDVVAFTESREACQPFYPEKIVPLDAYIAAILDTVVIQKEMKR
jgi:ethanolamine utilization protein EutN